MVLLALVAGPAASSAPGATSDFVYDELGRLSAVVDGTGAQARYRFDAVGNILGITRIAAPTAGIVDFSPHRARTGALVTIVGRGFGAGVLDNQVKFNGATAQIVSASSTRIVARVPTGATAGPITVTTGLHVYTSTQSFALPPGAPAISNFTPRIVASGGAVAITGSNFRPDPVENVVTFNGLTGTVGSSTATRISAALPARATSGRVSVSTPYGSATSLGMVFVPPEGKAVGDVGFTGTLSVGGSTTASVTQSGKIGLVAFNGTANARVALTVSENTIPYGYVTIRKPDGNVLWYGSASAGGTRWSDTLVLPVAGTYTIEVDPDAAHTGSLKLGLKTVPADSAGTIAIGGSSTVTITGAGQNARRTFTGAANARVALTISDNTIAYGYVTVKRPDGTTLWYSSASAGGTRWSDTLVLPVTGTYTIEVDPDAQHTGALKLGLETVPADSTGTIAIGGSSTVTITGAGQNARRTFTGAANARIALTISDNTIAYGYVTIRKPDGTTLWYSSASAGNTRWSDTLVLPVAGTYTIEVDPEPGTPAP